jgi:hypothetical protein
MAYEHSMQRYKHWYATLLRLYPKPYRERFGEPMEQTFNDLLRERAEEERGLFSYALWMFVETFAGIIRENLTFIIMQNITKRLSVWAIIVALILLIPLVLTLLGSGVDGEGWHWTPGDFVFMGTLMFGTGLAYELVARKGGTVAYRVAVGVALAAAFLLVWMNGAVGIIGNEGQTANLMYFGVLAVGFIGALIARFRPHGMARALFATALAQALVPVIALIAWPQISWGAAGVSGVFVLNGFFVALFVGSALLFRRAAQEHN